ncbi:hypothetical protein P154DRAFT_622443 [Amniculicola lignicola CBS 123094]|uniref:Uncharacterized protein n=1 Tax=Amniculicola lignicola CBS 123094 TaxID=1392246 RepID=A0A6A5W6D6_9PLEO|nr:hypothetical protein P154DRAFT_622443 [Amniculicola lignicola CBS 123094]
MKNSTALPSRNTLSVSSLSIQVEVHGHENSETRDAEKDLAVKKQWNENEIEDEDEDENENADIKEEDGNEAGEERHNEGYGGGDDRHAGPEIQQAMAEDDITTDPPSGSPKLAASAVRRHPNGMLNVDPFGPSTAIYTKNQQTSPFLRLPAHVRTRIYKLALTINHVISTHNTSLVYPSAPPSVERISVSTVILLLFTSRQIYTEAALLPFGLYDFDHIIRVNPTNMGFWDRFTPKRKIWSGVPFEWSVAGGLQAYQLAAITTVSMHLYQCDWDRVPGTLPPHIEKYTGLEKVVVRYSGWQEEVEGGEGEVEVERLPREVKEEMVQSAKDLKTELMVKLRRDVDVKVVRKVEVGKGDGSLKLVFETVFP